MNGNENRYLGEEPVGSLMRKYAIPCSMPLSDLLTFLIALFLIIQTYRELGMGDVKKAAVASAP